MTDPKFEGRCNICGEPITFEPPANQAGSYDIGLADDGSVYTWIRHYATAPEGANPDCAVYFSVVHEVA